MKWTGTGTTRREKRRYGTVLRLSQQVAGSRPDPPSLIQEVILPEPVDEHERLHLPSALPGSFLKPLLP